MVIAPSSTVEPTPPGDRVSTSNNSPPKGSWAVCPGVIVIVKMPEAGVVRTIPPLVVDKLATTGEDLSSLKSDLMV